MIVNGRSGRSCEGRVVEGGGSWNASAPAPWLPLGVHSRHPCPAPLASP